MHVVGDLQHVAGKCGDAVLPRVGDLALGAPAQIFHLGERAQQLVLEIGGRFEAARDLLGRHHLGRRTLRQRLGRIARRRAGQRSVSVIAIFKIPRDYGPGYQASSGKDQGSFQPACGSTTLAV